ncbi:NuA4-domain-containing protein [Punctularia strigosozonata HHB-11173 SS5]|uniref:NuA4-domain-containing protein n=1 Tax=Punctularia strigosozonata (strain HHB-11173) TaxID=741275 RepID=UPI0004417E58|nr:NuA4-domain-containing protein [Punctularia strigosozonata HHB-11173 SS5]EIN12717.1 NuA4-domain-containing protein [Punctularia strigosozonata HHB-11173 SS5]
MSTDAAPSAEDKARYDSLRKELVQALTKKRQLDKQLAATELGIYNLEGNYLAEALRDGGGNIIHGFENYLKNQNTARRKTELSDADRFFSNSSVTYQKARAAHSLELMGDGEESTATIDDGKLTAGSNSVVVPIPPAGKSEMSAAQHKKNRDREYQRRKRASNRKSATGQDSDDESVSTMSSKRPTKRARLAEDE